MLSNINELLTNYMVIHKFPIFKKYLTNLDVPQGVFTLTLRSKS
jgi:hypothetical protein